MVRLGSQDLLDQLDLQASQDPGEIGDNQAQLESLANLGHLDSLVRLGH